MVTLNTFYKSDEWSKLMAIIKLERANEQGNIICEHCGLPIVKKYDCIGHHKTELTEANVNDADISLNPDNIMLVHHKCHNKIHERFGYCKQKAYIVYGSPCSGKSTWVNSVAHKDDLIVDMDSIWQCICNSDREHKPNRLKANVFGIRDALLDQIKCRIGMWRNAYYIATLPLCSDRERLSKILGAELIFIDEDKETCLSRCENEQWKEFVDEWFELYTPGYQVPFES